MKICYLIHDQDGLFYRHGQYLPLFAEKKINIESIPVKKNFFTRFMAVLKASEYDIVIVRRKLLQPWENMLLKIKPCKVVFDFDDAILFKSSAPYHSLGRKIKFISMMKSADIIIAGNSYLKSLAAKYTIVNKIHILPTAVDLSKYRKKDYTEKSSKVTLGWIGSRSTLKYLKELKPVLNRLGARYKNLKLKIVADMFFDLDDLPVEKKEWGYDSEVDDLKSFDIGLMPLEDNIWSRGKCSFKLIQYLAVGIPCVCSPVGMNCDVIENGKTGLWASSPAEWEKQLSRLIEDAGLREKMGSAAGKQACLYDQRFIFNKFYKILLNTMESE